MFLSHPRPIVDQKPRSQTISVAMNLPDGFHLPLSDRQQELLGVLSSSAATSSTAQQGHRLTSAATQEALLSLAMAHRPSVGTARAQISNDLSLLLGSQRTPPLSLETDGTSALRREILRELLLQNGASNTPQSIMAGSIMGGTLSSPNITPTLTPSITSRLTPSSASQPSTFLLALLEQQQQQRRRSLEMLEQRQFSMRQQPQGTTMGTNDNSVNNISATSSLILAQALLAQQQRRQQEQQQQQQQSGIGVGGNGARSGGECNAAHHPLVGAPDISSLDHNRALKALGTSMRPKNSTYIDASSMSDPHPTLIARRRTRGGVTEPFPEKLHRMLAEVDEAGDGDIISFYSHGRAFGVHDPQKFVSKVMPKYFKQSHLSSFQRQLNLYGFTRISSGPDTGGYYHELFLKGRPALCIHMRRVGVPQGEDDRRKNKLGLQKAAPDFYSMKAIGVPVKKEKNEDNEKTQNSEKNTSSSSKTEENW